VWPTQPPIQWVHGDLSPGLKRPGREADHSPPSIAEVENAWSYTSTYSCLMPRCLVKHTDNFNAYLFVFVGRKLPWNISETKTDLLLVQHFLTCWTDAWRQ